ncbi:hypothetical protein PROFUN_14565 [Planoprotostelium fungivorum]|uniref:Uncharacterized protein n=1 Tax=Planoprotostelium fungivorum TaxID=1890364 RepID=A0A2P6MZ93_9EUKA|nr:hypothetical protein PROFUN_14565 [Planoprotostelium fungivorum]
MSQWLSDEDNKAVQFHLQHDNAVGKRAYYKSSLTAAWKIAFFDLFKSLIGKSRMVSFTY